MGLRQILFGKRSDASSLKILNLWLLLGEIAVGAVSRLLPRIFPSESAA
jgi:hypothetical protein